MEILKSSGQFTNAYSARKLLSGNLVAFPTETVYGLGADALNESSISEIYRVKGRPSGHPLIVHIPSADYLDFWSDNVPRYVQNLTKVFWPGPLTLILRSSALAKKFAFGVQEYVALRVPSHPVALGLLTEFSNLGGLGIAAPSANRFGKVSPTSANAVISGLGKYLSSDDVLIDGGICKIGLESTILRCSDLDAEILRPGVITKNKLKKVAGISISDEISLNQIAAPGLLKNHYAPNARVQLNIIPKHGDGLIALRNFITPEGVVRLASPKNNAEYAYLLYESFRKADDLGLQNIVAITPVNSGIGFAINDRLRKAAE